MMNRESKKRKRQRTGVILAAVLMTLLVVVWIGTELTRTSVLRRREVQQAEQRQQAFWIGESAVHRALHALAQSPDYGGETWEVDADTLGAGDPGQAVISIESSEEEETKRVVIRAYYPKDAVHRTACTRELIINSTGVSP